MLAWQQFILLHIIFASLMTIWYRKVSLNNTNNFFVVSLIVYFCVSLSGVLLAYFGNNNSLPPIPGSTDITIILAAGTFIVIAWLANYKLISRLGAFTSSISTVLKFVFTAILGVIVLGDDITVNLMIGGLFLVFASIYALNIGESNRKKDKNLLINTLILIVASLAFAIGIMFEKASINSIGVWDYTLYGWTMQLFVAMALFLLFGRKELKYANSKTIKYSFVAGILTSIAGGLFVYSLSLGLLSSVVLAASAKISLTAVLAVWLLKETKYLKQRFISLSIAIIGLVFMFS